MLTATGSASRTISEQYLAVDKHHSIISLEFQTNDTAQEFILNLLRNHHAYSSEYFMEIRYIDLLHLEVDLFFSIEEIGKKITKDIKEEYDEFRRANNKHWWKRFFD